MFKNLGYQHYRQKTKVAKIPFRGALNKSNKVKPTLNVIEPNALKATKNHRRKY